MFKKTSGFNVHYLNKPGPVYYAGDAGGAVLCGEAGQACGGGGGEAGDAEARADTEFGEYDPADVVDVWELNEADAESSDEAGIDTGIDVDDSGEEATDGSGEHNDSGDASDESEQDAYIGFEATFWPMEDWTEATNILRWIITMRESKQKWGNTQVHTSLPPPVTTLFGLTISQNTRSSKHNSPFSNGRNSSSSLAHIPLMLSVIRLLSIGSRPQFNRGKLAGDKLNREKEIFVASVRVGVARITAPPLQTVQQDCELAMPAQPTEMCENCKTKECQRAHWKMHKPDCVLNVQTSKKAEAMGPDYSHRHKAILKWFEIFSIPIGAASASALDVMNHPENMDKFAMIIYVDFLGSAAKGPYTYDVVDAGLVPLDIVDAGLVPAVDVLRELALARPQKLEQFGCNPSSIHVWLADRNFPWSYTTPFVGFLLHLASADWYYSDRSIGLGTEFEILSGAINLFLSVPPHHKNKI
ncbi:hypothetical protein C8R43DRAFT_952587 [Mycena crocata]|nr:hypothetical protein C8R43DRAFT_952587 [Mycena crocata]